MIPLDALTDPERIVPSVVSAIESWLTDDPIESAALCTAAFVAYELGKAVARVGDLNTWGAVEGIPIPAALDHRALRSHLRAVLRIQAGATGRN